MAIVESPAAKRARQLRWWLDSGSKINAEDEAWLVAFEAAQAKRASKKEKVDGKRLASAEAKAKREGRSLTIEDLRKASQPAVPATRKRAPHKDLAAARAALDHALEQERSVEALAYARALALAALPRNRTKERQIAQECRIGATDWLVITYTAMIPGVDLIFGLDLLAILAISDRVHRSGQTRLEFDSLRDTVVGLATDSVGGRTAELAIERLHRAAGTGITMTFYRSKSDAQARQNHYRAVNFTVVRDWWVPGVDRQAEALLTPYIEVSSDFAEHIRDPKALLWVPVEVVKALSSRPLALQLFMLIYPRAQSTQSWWEMPFSELVGLLNETDRRERDLVRDLQGALDEIHQVTGGRLRVSLVEEAAKRPPAGRGRPQKRWALRFGPSQSLTRKPTKQLKG